MQVAREPLKEDLATLMPNEPAAPARAEVALGRLRGLPMEERPSRFPLKLRCVLAEERTRNPRLVA